MADVSKVLSFILILSVTLYFVKSRYFKYKDMRFVLFAFVSLTLAVFIGMINFFSDFFFELLEHSCIALVAWSFVVDSYLDYKGRRRK